MWNERYRRGEFPADPAPVVVRAVEGVAPGRALDLACGAGRHARYLAGRGWDVVAIDESVAALELAGAPAAPPGRITTMRLDLERDPLPFPDRSFDLVLIVNFLHRPLFAEAMRVVRPGGRVVIQTLREGRFAAAAGELARIFAAWEIVFEEAASIVAIRPRGAPSAPGGRRTD